MNASQQPQTPPTGPFDAANRRFMRLLGTEGGTLTKLWMVVAGFNLGAVVLTAAIQIRTNAPLMHELFTNPSSFAQPAETSLLSLLIYPMLAIAGAMYWASFRAVRAVDDRGEDVGFNEARNLLFSRVLPVGVATVGFGLATGLGAMCCLIPGLVAMYFFYLAPYLVSEGMPIGEAFGESMDRAKRHAPLVCLLLGITTIGGFGSALLQFFAIGVFDGVLGSTGILAGSVVAWAMGSIIGYFMWLYSGAVFITISKAEENERRAPRSFLG